MDKKILVKIPYMGVNKVLLKKKRIHNGFKQLFVIHKRCPKGTWIDARRLVTNNDEWRV